MASKSEKAVNGHDCNFVPEPSDSLKYLICLAMARDPWQHGKCGRLFCEKCLDEYEKDSQLQDGESCVLGRQLVKLT